MKALAGVHKLGGVASRADLIEACGEVEVRRAIRAGELVRVRRGVYGHGNMHDAVRRATALAGVVSHRSAAQLHGWAVATPPLSPDVTVAHKRRLNGATGVRLHFADLASADHDGRVTGVKRTLLDCMRNLEFAEALAVADSALRADAATRANLEKLAAKARGPGSRQARRVAALATSRAANPMESVLRAIAVDVPGLEVTAQLPVELADGTIRHPDLGDARLRLAIEGEGFASHSKRHQLLSDCARFNEFTLVGWRILRFGWEHIMNDRDYVTTVLKLAVRGTGITNDPGHALGVAG